MQADITIFLPVYNGANYITQAIESVLKQTYQNWKFLIVDNCSTDNTAEICKPYLADPRFKYILNEKNLGVHGNFHKALGMCDTKYFAYLSHDDIYVRSDAFEEARSRLFGGWINVQTISTVLAFLKLASQEKHWREK